MWVVFIFIDNLAMGDGERVLSDNYTETFIIVGPLHSFFFFFKLLMASLLTMVFKLLTAKTCFFG